MPNEFEHINNKVFEICNYDISIAKKFIEQFEEFVEQLEQNETIEEYGEISNTEELISIIKEMQDLDTDKLKKVAYRINFLDNNYTNEIKEAILNRVEVIEFNNFGAVYTFESIQNELLEMINDVAADYGIILDGNEEIV